MRPDQPRFDLFSRHLEEIDAVLSEFCTAHNLELRKNPHRQPGRDIYQKSAIGNGELELSFGINLDGYWLQMDYQEDLPHDVGVIAIYREPPNIWFIKRAMLLEHQPFSRIKADLLSLLSEGWKLLESWTPPVITGENTDFASQGWMTQEDWIEKVEGSTKSM